MNDILHFDHYEDALNSLKQAIDEPLDDKDFVRDSVIQRFEFSVELTWKILKRFLKIVYSQDVDATKEIFRIAAKCSVISDVESWFGYINARNKTSHTYNEKIAEEVYRTAKLFYVDAVQLLLTMKIDYARHNE